MLTVGRTGHDIGTRRILRLRGVSCDRSEREYSLPLNPSLMFWQCCWTTLSD